MTKLAIIVQARMTSTRLPGKVLLTVMGKPLLSYQIERLRRIRNTELVVATTRNREDDAIEAVCRDLDVIVFRGDENDVLSRYHGAALSVGADVVVRVTSDCPLIDPDVSERVINRYLSERESVDYVSNTLVRTYPRGLDTEIFPFSVLDIAYKEAGRPYEREHVTPYIYTHPERFRVGQVTDVEDRSRLRWTVDTPEDFEFVRLVLENLYPTNHKFCMRHVLDTLRLHPDWAFINANVVQKKLGE
jgi:spore coat polysaccharide biosynthesis protein SpsF